MADAECPCRRCQALGAAAQIHDDVRLFRFEIPKLAPCFCSGGNVADDGMDQVQWVILGLLGPASH